MFNLFVGSLLNQSLDQLQLAMGQCNHCNAVHAAVQIPTQLHTDGFSPLKRSRAAWNAQLVAANAKMSKDSISSTPCPQVLSLSESPARLFRSLRCTVSTAQGLQSVFCVAGKAQAYAGA